MTAKELRENFTLRDGNTAISQEDFINHFQKTKERVRFTFHGWDGKSYNGESRNATVYRTDVQGCEDNRYIKVGKSIHLILEDKLVQDINTGKFNPTTLWVVDVSRNFFPPTT